MKSTQICTSDLQIKPIFHHGRIGTQYGCSFPFSLLSSIKTSIGDRFAKYNLEMSLLTPFFTAMTYSSFIQSDTPSYAVWKLERPWSLICADVRARAATAGLQPEISSWHSVKLPFYANAYKMRKQGATVQYSRKYIIHL